MVTIAEHLSRHWRRAGVAGITEWGVKHYLRKFRFHPGENVYSKQWDVLVVLDACRLDLLEEVASNWEWIESVESFDSLESSTAEWMRANFDEEHSDEIAETVYVCGNPQSVYGLTAQTFAHLEEPWRYAWDDDLGTMSPRPITDQAIRLHRNREPARMIVHYMQPHIPFVGAGKVAESGAVNQGRLDNTWTRLQRGELAKDTVWEWYRQNLEFILAELEVLRTNVDADTLVVSSDHGNAFGEWGIYEHPPGVPLECLRKVPWVETTGVDEGTHQPERYDKRPSDVSLGQRLRSLGYAE